MSRKPKTGLFYIYCINNLINGKNYIGQTNDPEDRWYRHKYAANFSSKIPITRSIAKEGENNFTFTIIATTKTRKDINYLEILCIQQYESLIDQNGYNIQLGGGSHGKTLEIKKRISQGLKEHYKTHIHHFKGKKFSEQHKSNISAGSMGKAGTNLGKIFNEEWCNKISTSNLGTEHIKNRRFNEQEEKKICQMYVDGYSGYRLAKLFECQRSLIYTILDRNNIKQKTSNYLGHKNGRNIFTIEQELEICELFKNSNLTIIKIAKQYKCGKTTIREIIIRNGYSLKRDKKGEKNDA